jgi:phage-related minor tail protein
MPNVGYATIQIIPSVRGIGGALRQQLEGPAGQAGGAAGEAAGGRLKDSVKAGAAAAGALAGALLVKGIADAVGQMNVKSMLQAQLGTSDKVAAQQGKVAGKLFASGVSDSFEGAADAIKNVMQAGLAPPEATQKQLQGIATKASDLATVFDQDLGGVTNAVSQMLRTGLASSAEQAFDVITKGFQSGVDKGGDLLDTVNEYGTQFRKAGLDGTTAIGLLNQAIRAGARDSDVAADAIKEFSIRAVDGSKTSIDGFKALGLSADDMAAKFAQGGSAATGVLDITLARLRDIKDPVQQSQAAVALFGTQAEDLGKALLAMDPSTAAAGLGTVGGAAQALGDTIRSGPSYELQVFTRTLQQGLVDFLGGTVIPKLVELSTTLKTGVEGALTALNTAFSGTIQWFKEWGILLSPLVALVGALAAEMLVSAAAAGANAAGILLVTAAMRTAGAVTKLFAGAQALLNAVMALNPITLIVIALVALGAALVVAYNKSETFRAIVQAAWAGIQTAALWAWENVLKPVFAALALAFKVIADAATWLWVNAIKPAFDFIVAAGRILFTILGTIVLAPLYLLFKALGEVALWLWDTAIKPIFTLIGAQAMWLWDVAIKPVFNQISLLFQAFGVVAMWLWSNVIKPVFEAIGGKISEWWTTAKFIFGFAIDYIKGPLAESFMNFWNGTIKPVWEGIKATIAFVWDRGIRPVFDALGRGVDTVKGSFDAGVSAIGLIWDRLREITRKPVQFVVDTVYNNGIRKVWNTIADFTGAGKLDAVKFAEGGRTYGGTPGRDSIPALMMADEYVIRRDSARRLGFGTLDYINRYGSLPGFAAGGPVQHFKDGGVVGWIKGAASSVGDFFGDMTELITNPGKAWQAATGFIRDKIASISGSGFGQLIGSVPTKILSSLKEKVVSLMGSFGGSDIGGSGVQRWAPLVLQALSMLGQPASLLQTTLRRMNQESGGNPFAINNWDSNAMAGDPSRGLMQTIGSTFNAYAGPLRSRGIYDPLANIYASMRYALDRYGSIARAYNQPGGYDSGGWLMPGVTTVVNGTGRPEAVLTGGQWEVARAALASGGAGDQRQYHITLQGSRMTSEEQAADLVRHLQFHG